MDYGWLNIGSVVFGLIAYILPANIIFCNKLVNKNWIIFSGISTSACIISLWMQIVYINHLVNIEDWTAIMDTSNAIVCISSLLLLVTITLNVILYILKNKKDKKILINK